MKTLALVTFVALLSLLSSCAWRSANNAPTAAMSLQSGVPLTELGEGHAIFMRHCSQCHEQRIPKEIPSAEWHKIVPGMAWNAGLSHKEEKLVEAYVVAASKAN